MARKRKPKKPNQPSSVSYRQNSYRAVATVNRQAQKARLRRKKERMTQTAQLQDMRAKAQRAKHSSPLGDRRGVIASAIVQPSAGPVRGALVRRTPNKNQVVTHVKTRKNGWRSAVRAAMDRHCVERPNPTKAGAASGRARKQNKKPKTQQQRNREYRRWC